MIYYFFFNKYYEVNDYIVKAEINCDGNLILNLKNGIKLFYKPSKYPAQINFTERYNYGKKSRLSKILDVSKFYFVYDLIDELYIRQNYFQYFDLNEGDKVVDAGANIGLFTVLAAKKLNNTGKVIAIEPDDNNFEILKENIKINELTNVIPVKKGLWKENTTLEFNLGLRPGEHSLHENDQMSGEKVKIDCITLDNLLSELNIKSVNFIKMDIEGAEIEALQGCQTILKSESVKWVIEALHIVEGQPTYKKIVPVIEASNYHLLTPVDNYRGTIYASKQVL